MNRHRKSAVIAGAFFLISLGTAPSNAGFLDWMKNAASKKTPVPSVDALSPADNQNYSNGLKILNVAPAGMINDAGETFAVTVTFDRPMVAFEALSKDEIAGPLSFDPPIKGKYRWFGVSTLQFRPEAALPPATRFVAKIPAGTAAKDGTKLSADYAWTFDSLRPQFLNSNPYHQSEFVELRKPILLTFNLPMSSSRARPFIVLRGHPTHTLFGSFDAYDEKSSSEEFPVEVRSATAEESKNFRWAAHDDHAFLVVVPKRDLPIEYTFTLVLQKGLPSDSGNLGLDKDAYLQFKTYNHFRVVSMKNTITPNEGLEIWFSNPVKFNGKRSKWVKFDPAVVVKNKDREETVDEEEDEEGGYMNYRQALSLPFAARQRYHLVIVKGLTDKFGQKLETDYESNFDVTSYVPWLSMPSGNVTIEGKLKHRLAVDYINLRTAQRFLYPVTPTEAIARLQNRTQGQWVLPDGKEPETWTLDAPLNKSALASLEFNSVLNKSARGFLFASIEPGEADPRVEPYPLAEFERRRNQIETAFVQVTDMGITAKCSPENNLIWVTALADAKPLSGADVKLYDDGGKLLWTGRTNGTGLAVSPGWGLLNMPPKKRDWDYNNPRVWIVASHGADTAMVASDWGTGIYPYSFGLAYEYRQIYPEFAGHVYSERGLYQTGETAHIKGLFRQKKQGDWSVSEKRNVVLTIRDSRGQQVLKKNLVASDYGAFSADFDIPAQAVTGRYSMTVREASASKEAVSSDETAEASDASESEEGEGEEGASHSSTEPNKIFFSGGFMVEAYRAAKFEVKTSLDREEYVAGDRAAGTIRASYLFGAPMKDRNVSWTARLWETFFEPQGHPDYTFGPQRYTGRYGSDAHESSLQLASKDEKLNANGELNVQFPLNPGSLRGAMQVQLEGTVADVDRQALSGRHSALVHAADFYLGLRASSSFIDEKKPLVLSVISVAPDGAVVTDKRAIVKFVRREWNSVRKAGIKGRTGWLVEQNDVEVQTSTCTTAAQPVAVKYQPTKAGYYLVHAESKDAGGRTAVADTYFYVTGTDYVPWERSDDDRIDLVADRITYKPGDTAKIMVKSPFEKATALVSIEREKILRQFVTTVNGSADVIRIPLEDLHVPNVFVSVILLQGRTAQNKFSDAGDDVGKPAFKIGYANLPVDPGTRRLSVEVSSDKKEYRPREKVTVDFQVKDARGHGRKAECSVAVADRGVINLIGYKTPNSFDSFYGPRSLSVETVESRLHVIGQRNFGEKGENRGGGGFGAALALSDADMRMLFVGTAFWKASVITDGSGKAKLTFDLPDNLTSFRIMVTAQTLDSHFGAGESDFQVKKRLMLTPSLPRFARLGDQFRAGVVIHNYTSQNAPIQLQAGTAGVQDWTAPVQTVSVEKGGAKEVLFDINASKAGTLTFQFAAASGAEKDGLKTSVPVIVPRPTEAVALTGDTTAAASFTVKFPSDIYSDVGGLQVEAASTALIGLKDGVRYLTEYPYECLEQKMSRLLPFLLAGDLMEAFGVSQLKGKDKDAVINAALKQFPPFQKGDGGFAYWPDSPDSCEYLTAYAALFLYQAKRNGYAIDEPMLNRALVFLAKVLRRGDGAYWNYPYNRNAQLETRAFIVYALALWGKDEPAYLGRLYDAHRQIPLFGRTLLLKALHLNQMNKQMEDTVAASLFNSIKEDPTRAHFEEQDPTGLDWVFDSPVRTTAFILQAMVESERDFPQSAKTIRWIMDERKNGRWRSTQENIYVFDALATYFRRYEKDEPHFTASIKLGGQEALKALFQGRSAQLTSKTIPWTELTRGQGIPAVASKDGAGRLYYGLRMIYAPTGPLAARDEGLRVERTVTTEDGKPLPKIIPAGTKVLVKLNVTSPFDRTYIVAEDALPAGFQVVNTAFETASSHDAAVEQKSNVTPGGFYTPWWGGFDHREIYDDRVAFFADFLEHGTHTVSYVAIAVVPGTFSEPAAKAEGMYTPEVFGRTNENKIEIK